MAALTKQSSKQPTRVTRTPTSVWLRVREEYQQGQGSCAELAKRHGLTAGAVSSRCKREKWRMAVTKLDQRLDEQLDQLTKAKAETLAERAVRLRERMLDESEGWLDQIQRAKALVAANDTQGLKELINAWHVPVQVSTKLLRLDETPAERPLVVIGLIGQLREAAGRQSVIDLPPVTGAECVEGARVERG